MLLFVYGIIFLLLWGVSFSFIPGKLPVRIFGALVLPVAVFAFHTGQKAVIPVSETAAHIFSSQKKAETDRKPVRAAVKPVEKEPSAKTEQQACTPAFIKEMKARIAEENLPEPKFDGFHSPKITVIFRQMMAAGAREMLKKCGEKP